MHQKHQDAGEHHERRVELPFESSGSLASPQTATAKGDTTPVSTLLSASIGQSYNDFTPVQVAKYIAMVANRGRIVTEKAYEHLGIPVKNAE